MGHVAKFARRSVVEVNDLDIVTTFDDAVATFNSTTRRTGKVLIPVAA